MAKPGPKRSTTGARAGDETKQRIVSAALEALAQDGIVGASARSIARRGDFNQALIFYHFGSVDDLLLAAVDELSGQRVARYESRLEGVTSLRELVAIAGELHEDDMADGHMTVLSQMLAAAATNPALRGPMRERFDPWIAVVERTVHRVLDGTAYASIVPAHQLAIAVSSLFVGLELFLNLEDADAHGSGTAIFATLQALAAMLETILGLDPEQPS